ncbi:MAG: hypothetical protein M3N14_07370, partial [Bacteroidota bacterium]|nr:hypothetical protein [Bacteroidota bacterium]
MDTNNTTERIIKYLDGDLSAEELKAFELLLDRDKEVKEELESLSLAQKAVISYGLKEQVAAARAEMVNEAPAEGRGAPQAKIYALIRPMLQVAAGLVFFLLAIGVYQYATVSPSKLYEENYQPYKASVTRGGDNSVLDAAYVSGEMKTVISLFEKMAAPDNKASFLAGQAYLLTRQPKKAIGAFNNVVTSAGRSFKEDAEYYLALSYMDNDQPAKARVVFKRIYRDNDHLYHDRVSYLTMLK